MAETHAGARITEPRAFCYRCFKAAVVCVCPTLVRVANRTHVHIIQHPREQNCPIGTVRFARLGLERCEVEVLAPWDGVPSALSTRPPDGVALLYPSPHARPVESLAESERPQTLVVLDGTWHQAKVLYRENPWLGRLPHVFLSTPVVSRYRIRAEPKDHYLSTFEAIAATLARLEPETRGLDELLRAFDAMIDAQVEHIHDRGAVRVRSRRRPAAVPSGLREQHGRHVVVYAETVGPRGDKRPLQVCAHRLATGERFEQVIAHDDPHSVRKREHLGLTVAAIGEAVSETTFAEQWGAYLRDDDILVAWSQRVLDVMAASRDSIALKGWYCNLERRAAGDLRDVLARHGLTAEHAPFGGRAGRYMGGALALLGWLRSRRPAGGLPGPAARG